MKVHVTVNGVPSEGPVRTTWVATPESFTPRLAVISCHSGMLLAAMALRRLAQIDATAHTIAKHDCAVAGDGSVTRVRVESGAVKRQRVANPAVGPWNAWNNLATGMGAQVACAAKGARVAVVYVDAAGTGIKLRESTDNGVTYGSEVAVTTAGAAVNDLAVAYRTSGGDLAVAWAAGANIGIIKRTGGAFGSAATTAPGS